jgi:hypothetical protein
MFLKGETKIRKETEQNYVAHIPDEESLDGLVLGDGLGGRHASEATPLHEIVLFDASEI